MNCKVQGKLLNLAVLQCPHLSDGGNKIPDGTVKDRMRKVLGLVKCLAHSKLSVSVSSVESKIFLAVFSLVYHNSYFSKQLDCGIIYIL